MGRWANKYVIGVTGNIATGKSVVRQMLQHLEAYTVDADSLSHRAMAPGAPAYRPVLETFGQFILDAEKNIDRKMLGNIVFNNPVALAKLEAIVHPIIGQAINVLITRAPQRVVAIEAIKLLEGELAGAVDEVWVVDASPDTQVQRLMSKRSMSEAEARQRIGMQGAQADKLAKAQVVIKNDGNVEETWKQVNAAWNAIQRKLALPAPAAPPAQPVQQVATVRPPAAEPVQPVPAPVTPAQPTPVQVVPAAPVSPASPATATQPAVPVVPSAMKINVKRGMPSNAEAIAGFITTSSGRAISRMDVMMAFGQKSYLLAFGPENQVLGMMGWQVENLITRIDEFYVEPGVPVPPVVEGLVAAVEAASKDLQSEVAYIFLPQGSAPDVFRRHGYEPTTIEQIKIPAWREAVQEVLSQDSSMFILAKRLREDRVLKPI